MYVVQIKNLNQALKDELELKKIHQVIKCEQSYWMKPCIILNTKLRSAAKNQFQKDFFKVIKKCIFRTIKILS